MQNVENDIFNSDIGPLREEISKAKQPIDKKWYIIGGSVLAAIIIIILLFLFVFNTTNVNFTFYLNDALVTENLDVTVSYADTVLTLTTIASTLSVDLPNKTDVTLEITTEGYQTTQLFFIDNDAFDVKIKKATSVADSGQADTPIDVKINVYAEPNFVNLYSTPINVNLKCSQSGKVGTLMVVGSTTYSKEADCGSLILGTSPYGFLPITNQPCNETVCSITLKTTSTTQDSLKNNLIVKTIEKGTTTPVSDVNVTVTKVGYSLTDKTDASGSTEFVGLDIGTYTVKAEIEKKNVLYQLIDSAVVVSVGTFAITKTFEFDFSDANILSITVDANEDDECEFGVDVWDVNTLQKSFMTETGEENKLAEIDSGIYYLNVVPLYDCSTLYSPVYNKQINHPKDGKIIVEMKSFDKDNLVLVNVNPQFGSSTSIEGVYISVKESDNNRLILEQETDESGNLSQEFVLFHDEKYIIEGEKDSLSGKVEDYKYTKKDSDKDKEGFYNDTVILPLNMVGVGVNFNVVIDTDKNTDFKLLASWKDAVTDTISSFEFDGNIGKAQIIVPAGTPILFKVSKNKQIESLNLTYQLNYYLNSMTFSKEISKYDVNVNFDSQSLGLNKTISTLSPIFYLDPYLNNSVKVDDLSGNTDYFVPFDVVGGSLAVPDCFEEFSGLSGDNLVGNIISIDGDNFVVENILSYSFDSSVHATEGFDFKPLVIDDVSTAATGIFPVVIFRAVAKVKMKNYDKSTSGTLKYGTSFDIPLSPSNSLDFTVKNVKTGEPKDLDSVLSLDLQKTGLQSSIMSVPFVVSNLPAINLKYKLQNGIWSARNTLTSCDLYAGSANSLINAVGLIDAIKDKNLSITADGLVSISYDVNENILKNLIDLPVQMDVLLDASAILTSASDALISTVSKQVPVTLKLNHPSPKCLEFTANDKKLLWELGFSASTNSGNIFYNDIFVTPGVSLPMNPVIKKGFNVNLKVENNCDINFNVVVVNIIGSNKKDQNIIVGNSSDSFTVNTDKNFEIDVYSIIDKKQKFNSQLFAKVVTPLNLSLGPAYKGIKDTNKINIDYSDDVNCAKNYCSKTQFDAWWIKNKANPPTFIYLMDDNHIDPNFYDNTGSFANAIAYTEWDRYQYKSGGAEYVIKPDSAVDQIFYHIPPYPGKSFLDSYILPYYWGVGSCLSLPSQNSLFYSENDLMVECKDDWKVSKKVYVSDWFGKNNKSVLLGDYGAQFVNLSVNFGFYTKTCTSKNYADCLVDENKFKAITTNPLESNISKFWLAKYDGNYYFPNEFFVFIDNNLIPRTTDVDLVAVFKPTELTDAQKKGWVDYSLMKPTSNAFVLERVITKYNDGFIKYKINSGVFEYVWDFDKVFNGVSEDDLFIFIWNPQNTYYAAKTFMDSIGSFFENYDNPFT